MDAATWAKAKDLIGDALELPPAERDDFVAARCSDPTLLAEIRTVLRIYADDASFLEKPAVATVDDGDGDDLPGGHQIGPYIVVDRLGRGGMGQVFLANDRRLKRKVALKRLLASRGQRGTERSRILSEARSAAQISHPNVATIHDVIDVPEGVFIVMEYVEGESLSARLRRERLSLAAALSIGKQLASALAAAHAKNVIHRDLKPGNVQVALDGTVKVLDFGIAQAVFVASTMTTPVAEPAPVPEIRPVRGPIAGTPGYMSPEQMAGANVDERSDLFSLGVVLFEMIAGRKPFAGVDLRNEYAAAVAARLDVAAPGTPDAVVNLVTKALAIDVDARFQSAAEMGAALAAVPIDPVTGTTLVPAGAAEVSLTTRFASRVALAVAVAAVLALFGLLTTHAFNLSLQRPSRFSNEGLGSYIILGFRANFLLLIVAFLLTMLYGGGRFVARTFGMVPWIARGAHSWRQRRAALSAQFSLHDPVVLGQSLAAVAAIGLVTVVVWFYPVILSYAQWVSHAPPERLYPLSPDASGPRGAYRVAVDILLLIVGLGMYRLVHLKNAQRSQLWTGAVPIVAALLFIILLLHIVPYRLMFLNKFERLDVSGERCYLVDELENDAFVFCTERKPPRNQVIRLDAPGVRRSGIFESMFVPPFESSAASGQAPDGDRRK
jgi:hypothetical protein